MSKTESWQIEPKHEQVCPALLCISKLNVKVNKEGTYVFGGATYGFDCTYDSGDYTFRFFFGRTLGGFGKQLHFELYFKGEKIAKDVIYGNRAEAFACFLRNIAK